MPTDYYNTLTLHMLLNTMGVDNPLKNKHILLKSINPK